MNRSRDESSPTIATSCTSRTTGTARPRRSSSRRTPARRGCQQENVLAQLAAVRALHAPVDNLLSNEAYMLMTALAWNLKAWLALSLPEKSPEQKPPLKGSKPAEKKPQPSDKQRLLGLEFRTFVNYFLRIPAQVVKGGRRVVVRLLAYNTWQPAFFRLVARFTRPGRC